MLEKAFVPRNRLFIFLFLLLLSFCFLQLHNSFMHWMVIFFFLCRLMCTQTIWKRRKWTFLCTGFSLQKKTRIERKAIWVSIHAVYKRILLKFVIYCNGDSLLDVATSSFEMAIFQMAKQYSWIWKQSKRNEKKCAALTNFHWIKEKCCSNISAMHEKILVRRAHILGYLVLMKKRKQTDVGF